ncbi:MAG: hypothetical protein OXC06_16470 [Acidimicrobiaceae bacterium]|nr:hypothetical protein [Acidimicrobiaceae bacterium]
MDPTIAATVIGVLLTVAFGTFATMLAWLRSDTNARFDKVDARFDKMDDKVDARLERLEVKVDGLILGLTRKGFLADPEDSGSDD